MSVFHSAALTLAQQDELRESTQNQKLREIGRTIPVTALPRLEWTKAVAEGANQRSPRWRHLLMLGGLFVGFESKGRRAMPSGLSRKIQEALVTAANLSLDEARQNDLAAQSITMVLNHSFGLMSDFSRTMIEYDRVLPVLMASAFFSPEGLRSGYFLGSINLDLVRTTDEFKLSWPPDSPSYRNIQRLSSRPLMSALGPLSRLIAHAVENVKQPWIIQAVTEDIRAFSHTLMTQWRQNKLSEVDFAEERKHISNESLERTIPTLWRLLKSAMFASTIILSSVVSRMLGDSFLASDSVASILVIHVLHAIRNLFFISSRLGTQTFSQQTFVYLAAIDILAASPRQAETFIQEIAPHSVSQVPQHPLDRTLDLYFLNTAEHLSFALSPFTCQDLLIPSTAPYLTSDTSNNTALLDIFEAAHSLCLAIFSSSQNSHITARSLPAYVETLFSVFPQNLSPRQFRLAFKTVLKILSPPSESVAQQPDLPAIFMEMLHYKIMHASTDVMKTSMVRKEEDQSQRLSEQCVYILASLDALPFLPIDILEEQLGTIAQVLDKIENHAMREVCQERFWEVLSGGEMDVERSEVCVAWWGTKGGRAAVMKNQDREEYVMSEALPTTKSERRSKL